MLALKRTALMLSVAAAALVLFAPSTATATGNATVEVALGLKYKNGHGVPKNYAKALHYFRLAAAQGNAAGEDDLGYMYEHGQGVPRNYATALHWYRLAAAHGNANAAISHASLNRIAPADEYFGRHRESILEIRNRLDRFDERSDDDMLQPDTTHALADLQDAILDWQHRYPRDPWLPRSLQRLLRDYQRAGAASSPASLEIIALMRKAYPNDAGTGEMIASLSGSSEAPASDNAPPDVAPDSAPPDVAPDSAPPSDVAPDSAPASDVAPDSAPPPDVAPDSAPPPDVAPDSAPPPDVAPDSAPPPSEQNAQPDADTIALQGTVVDAQSGEPIIGAVIFVTTGDGTLDTSTPVVATGEDGSFSIDGLPASTLQVIVEPPRGSGYAPYRVTVDGSNGDIDAGVIALSVDD